MKFRKKPVVINAEQFFERLHAVSPYTAVERIFDESGVRHVIKTLEGAMTVSEGDWVIQGVNGEFYPCKPDIFDKTYEPV